MIPRPLFITGTDTEVGKTYTSIGLLTVFNQLGYTTLGIKPVSSGCQQLDGKLYNEDALALQKYSSIKLEYDEVNPFAFEQRIAPHIAAIRMHCKLSVKKLNQALRHTLTYDADVKIIEGCGGWHVPLNKRETMADFVIANQFNVILVVGIRLGCINHSILTMRAMQQDGVNIVGWIANCIDLHMKNADENIKTLQQWLPIPCLGIVEYGARLENAIDVKRIMERADVSQQLISSLSLRMAKEK